MMRAVPVPGGLPDAVTGVVSSTETGGSLAAMKRLGRWWSSARTIQDITREMADEDVSKTKILYLWGLIHHYFGFSSFF